MTVYSSWHPGEIAAQQARGYEDDVWGIWESYQKGAPSWMMLFLTQIPFLSVTTLDEKGRPWSSLLYNDGNAGFIQPSSEKEDHFVLTIRASQNTQIRTCLLRLNEQFDQGQSAFDETGIPKIEFQMAGVGVMLHNRRRNKLESVIVAVHSIPNNQDQDKFVFEAKALTTFGNCPKYINTRILLPIEEFSDLQESVKIENNTHVGQDLPASVLNLIGKADSLYLSTLHSGKENSQPWSKDPPRLGNNHRGGSTGYLRTYWDEEKQRRCIILPDWSGNRMMMSIGNITHDPVAGLVIPIWSHDEHQPGSLIQATCSAEVLANEEAAKLMRGVAGAVKMWIEDWTFCSGCMPMYVKPVEVVDGLGKKKEPKEDVGWSPYNPPIRLLKTEQSGLNGSDQTQAQEHLAILKKADFYSDQIATFTFSVDDQSISNQYKPGKHIVIDCHDALDTRIKMYSHMAQFKGGEKDLNDDGTRSWTISHAQPIESSWQFEITLRRKDRGGVTPTLFRIGNFFKDAQEVGMMPPPFKVKMNILGLEGSDLLPSRQSTKESPLRLVYLLSGIGITPLLSHLTQLVTESNTYANVLIILSTRSNEANVMQNVIRHAIDRASHGKDEIEGRIRLRLILLVSSTRTTDSDQRTGQGEEEVTWNDLSKEIQVDFTQLKGKRFTRNSLSAEDEAGKDEHSFILPSTDADKYLHDSPIDSAVVCAATTFSQTATQALAQANIPEEVQHVESFNF